MGNDSYRSFAFDRYSHSLSAQPHVPDRRHPYIDPGRSVVPSALETLVAQGHSSPYYWAL